MAQRLPSDPGGNGAVDLPLIDSTGVRRMTAAVEAQGGPPDLGVTIQGAIESAVKQWGGGGGGDGGGVPPDVHLKKIKRHNWGTIVAAMVSALGVAFGSYYATEARSKSNEKSIEEHESVIKEHTDDIRYIRVEVKEVGDKIDQATVQQTAIMSGIEELKKENVNRLKEELEDARRELRRERRQR